MSADTKLNSILITAACTRLNFEMNVQYCLREVERKVDCDGKSSMCRLGSVGLNLKIHGRIWRISF